MTIYNNFDQITAKTYRESLRSDCSQCFGLCCIALNITASSDFPINKIAGKPCPNLQSCFRCEIHEQLREKGFRGCTVFDCLGAGQMVSQHTFKGQSWRENPDSAEKMFRVFPIMAQLYEMLAYVSEALSYPLSSSLRKDLSAQLDQLERLTKLDSDALIALDVRKYRMPINELLLTTSLSIRNALITTISSKNKRKLNYRGVDWMGKKLSQKDLRATDLRGAYLIAADLQDADLGGVDFIGADLRDANVSGANLATSLFLTQMQINSAKGNLKTKLPLHLQRPSHWSN